MDRLRKINVIVVVSCIIIDAVGGSALAQAQGRRFFIEFKKGIDIHKAIDNIKEKYKILYIQKVFDAPATQAAADKTLLEKIKKKYPKRSKRIPPNSRIPALGSFYVIEFKKGVNLKSVTHELLADPNIKTVTPNRMHKPH